MWALRGLLLAAFISSSATPILADEVWSLGGFKEPESALFDPQRNIIYVSNIAGEATAKDGVGFISKVSPDGKLIELEWIKGLNGPKGLVMKGSDKLYVSDIDQLVEIDVDKGVVSNRWKAEGAQFLNDTAVDGDGRVTSRICLPTESMSSTTVRFQFSCRIRACSIRTVCVSKAIRFWWPPGVAIFSLISQPRLRAICFQSISRQRRFPMSRRHTGRQSRRA
jgi:hypothetical protein